MTDASDGYVNDKFLNNNLLTTYFIHLKSNFFTIYSSETWTQLLLLIHFLLLRGNSLVTIAFLVVTEDQFVLVVKFN